VKGSEDEKVACSQDAEGVISIAGEEKPVPELERSMLLDDLLLKRPVANGEEPDGRVLVDDLASRPEKVVIALFASEIRNRCHDNLIVGQAKFFTHLLADVAFMLSSGARKAVPEDLHIGSVPSRYRRPHCFGHGKVDVVDPEAQSVHQASQGDALAPNAVAGTGQPGTHVPREGANDQPGYGLRVWRMHMNHVERLLAQPSPESKGPTQVPFAGHLKATDRYAEALQVTHEGRVGSEQIGRLIIERLNVTGTSQPAQ
jgi:hypothetical protein